jgi:hypothetical protein
MCADYRITADFNKRDPPVKMMWQRAARFHWRTLTDGWGVSIKPRHWRQNFKKPRLYVSIAKNHDFPGNFLQFALIPSWTRIDAESDRWDPPVSAELVIHLKRIYNFLCSMLVYTPFALCFVCTSWRFYEFFGTNLLTRCHSASSLFSAVFVF